MIRIPHTAQTNPTLSGAGKPRIKEYCISRLLPYQSLVPYITAEDNVHIPALNPDINEARRSLALLDENDPEHCFQTIPGPSGGSARTLHGTLDSLRAVLEPANRQGAGIFVTPNKIKPGAKRQLRPAGDVRQAPDLRAGACRR